MIVILMSDPDQIRWWVQSALNGFDTLEQDTASANAKAELSALLAYLDRTEDATRVFGVVPIKPGVRDEAGLSDGKGPDQPDLKVVWP